ncbi:YbaL family putative K(+) efflux transporter, partial [Methyloceanibacter sp.]|uniref:YbaL family putative K(+) efflux transporter n=1 Tax=Methyloceanibacter sp. TaxID=1965321 RepID=UPI00351AF960
MAHSAPLISTLVFGLVLAFGFGLVAQLFKLPPLIGYLLAGIAIGPFTPGFVADQGVANQLAEIGVILLMFGVGLHFSLDDLLSVRAIAIPGAVAQALVATPLGMAVGWWRGWTPGAGLIFGIGLSIASTVVLLRLLQERRLLDTERGRITVGWLIVQDLGMVIVLVLLPVLAGVLKGTEDAPDPSQLLQAIALTLGKIAAFVIIMLVVGRKVIPLILHYVAHTGSRELFRLAVLSIALGFAFLASELFGVSLALGAFFAGMILSESRLSQQAATESLPLRDAFAVLFFVSVGMLFDPKIVVDAPVALFATIFIILVAKTAAAYLVVRLFGHPMPTALAISVSLAQIGEFSFILAGLGVSLAVLPAEARDLILAGAIISILVNPLLMELVDRLPVWRTVQADDAEPGPPPEARGREPIPVTRLTGHVVLIGHGRVGSVVSEALREHRIPYLVIESDQDAAAELRQQSIETITGNAADPEVVRAANLQAACCLLVAIPEAFEGGQAVMQARAANPNLLIIARAHSEEEVLHLKKHGASTV